MTSLRRNASESSGPRTEDGKQRSRGNAVRHGLTAGTVISALEDAEDYKAFEAAIAADHDAPSAVVRLASLMWRLRRGTTIETGLFEIQADQLSELTNERSRRYGGVWGAGKTIGNRWVVWEGEREEREWKERNRRGGHPAPWFFSPRQFPNFALLSQCHEETLWREGAQTLCALDPFNCRKPQERGSRFIGVEIS